MEFRQWRKEYDAPPLLMEDLLDDPFAQLEKWLEEVRKAEVAEPNAMVLATADKEGRPSSRMVLLKKMSEEGLVFFTNRRSRKACELEENPFASLTFYWGTFMRQVHVEGTVHAVSREIVESYFSSRTRESQLAAWASEQDSVLSSKQELEEAYTKVEQRYQGQSIPTPEFWGGYALVPARFEFWQGGAHRLHNRFRYRQKGAIWIKERLAP